MKPYTFNIQVPPPIPQQLVSLEDYPNYGETVDDTVAEDVNIYFDEEYSNLKSIMITAEGNHSEFHRCYQQS